MKIDRFLWIATLGFASTTVFLACDPQSPSAEFRASSEREALPDEEEEEEEDALEGKDEDEGEGEGDIPEPTQAEVMAFLKSHLPESLPLLERVRQEESLSDYQMVLERAADWLVDYQDTRLAEGPEAAELLLREQRVEFQVEQALIAWHDAETESARTVAYESLKKAVARSVDLDIEIARFELAILKEEVSEIEKELAEMTRDRDQKIEEQLREAIEDE